MNPNSVVFSFFPLFLSFRSLSLLSVLSLSLSLSLSLFLYLFIWLSVLTRKIKSSEGLHPFPNLFSLNLFQIE